MLRSAFWPLALVALLALGGASSTLAFEHATSSSVRAPDSLLLDVGELIDVTPGRRHSEFIVARDPSDPLHLAIAVIDWDDPLGSSACAIYSSRDGGQTWTGGIVEPFSNPHMQGDPWVAIDAQGRLHAICIEVDSDGGTGYRFSYHYSRSADDGASWSPRTRIPSPSGVDKGAIGIDGAGNLYVCYSGVSIHRSTDGGATWSARTYRPHGLVGNCNGIHAGPNGEVYVHFIALNGGALPFRGTGVIVSHDAGATWSEPSLAGVFWLERSSYATPAEPFQAPQGTFPQVAVSRASGHVFLTYQHVNAADRFELVLLRSTDEGASWTPVEVALGPESTCAACHVEHPGVAIDDAGRVGLRWTVYRSPEEPIVTWFAASDDEGATWSAPVELGATDALTESISNPRSLTPNVDPVMTAQAAPRLIPFATGTPPTAGESGALANAALYTALFPAGHTGGGDYWGLESTGDAFLATWIANYGSGRPQIWARAVG